MGNHVFLSHSHQDAPAAELIVKALEDRGVKCWIAPRDVPAGGSYAEAILTAIENASCFVLIYSEQANVSSHVLREVERALNFGLNIVPVRLDDSPPSKSLDYLLATVHWLSIAPDARDQSIVKAAEQIVACAAQPRTPRKPTTPAQISPNKAAVTVAPAAVPQKRNLVWIAVLVVLAIGGLIWFLVSRNPTSNPRVKQSEAAATAPAEKGDQPAAVMNEYVGFLTKRNATAAYNLLSEDYRRRLSIAKFSHTVGSKPPVKLVEANVVSKTEKTANLAAVFEDTDVAAHQAQWKATIDFVLESGVWRIDRMKGLYPANVRPIRDSANESGEETTPEPNRSTAASTPTPKPSLVPTPPPTPSVMPPSSPAPQTMHGVVQGPNGGATLHERPFAKANVVMPLKNGQRVEIDRIEGDWLHVIVSPDKQGFVHKSKVKINPKE
jgi:hypothetical protein